MNIEAKFIENRKLQAHGTKYLDLRGINGNDDCARNRGNRAGIRHRLTMVPAAVRDDAFGEKRIR